MSNLDIENACQNSANETIGTTSLAAASCNLSHLDRIANSTLLTDTNRVGRVSDTVAGFQSRVDSALREAELSFGFVVVGTFSAGYVIENYNQLGQDANGDNWRYRGATLPFTVTPGTIPALPDFEEIEFSAASGITYGTGTVEDALDEALMFNSKYNPATIQVAIDSTEWDSAGGEVFKVQGYHVAGVGRGKWETIVAGTIDYVDKPNGFGIVQCVGVPNLALKLVVDGWLNVKSYGLRGDRTTDDSAAEANLSASPYLFLYWPAGIYRTQLNNGTSNRTYLMQEGAIIDGVAHICTGTGPATSPPEASITWVDNVTVLGTLASTIRIGTFYTRKLNIEKALITEVSTSYLNQTAVGGSTGVHLYFGTKEMHCGEMIFDSGALEYNLSVDQGPVKGVDEVPENVRIDRVIINQTDVTGFVLAETIGLSIGEVIQKNQGGANVSGILQDNVGLKVGSYKLDGLGATSGQSGLFINDTDVNASYEFGTIDVSNVPGIGFRTLGTGTTNVTKLIAKNNREHARIQSKTIIQTAEGDGSSEIGVNFHDNLASGSYIGRAEMSGTAGTGINVGSDNITIPYAKCDGFATLYGLHIPLNTDNFVNNYYEGANCSQGLRILSAGDINMGVINLHDNTSGIVGSGLGKFGFDYVYYNNNGTDTNVTLELAAGFRGKKVRQSVSDDRGDNDVSLEVGIDAATQLFDSTFTANHTATLTTTGAQNGDEFLFSRTGGGAFGLSASGTVNNKSIQADEWMLYRFGAGQWRLVGKGSLA